jgi:diaminohydroxyphosphoribosylaminopyrimidine deaminase/5-amino-6-(5-phosphoribosylamino)uracil reductase
MASAATEAIDIAHMRSCLKIANHGLGFVSPNPLVGCVIAAGSEEVASGYHKKYGTAHAEVEALKGLLASDVTTDLTLYVNLEPCCHFGKTGPCTEAIIASGIKRVVIGCLDPFAATPAAGVLKLEQAGIEVVVGVLEEEALDLNRRFLTALLKKRPYIILKWAETRDGFIARSDGNSRWISSLPSRTLAHQWRSEEDAILVGTQTALLDDPELSVRHVQGRHPIRMVIDRHLRLPTTLKLFDRKIPCLVFNLLEDSDAHNLRLVKLTNNKDFFHQMLDFLIDHRVQSVLVEGGTTLLQAFLDHQLYDEIRIFQSTAVFRSGRQVPVLPQGLRDRELECSIGEDRLRVLERS